MVLQLFRDAGTYLSTASEVEAITAPSHVITLFLLRVFSPGCLTFGREVLCSAWYEGANQDTEQDLPLLHSLQYPYSYPQVQVALHPNPESFQTP